MNSDNAGDHTLQLDRPSSKRSGAMSLSEALGARRSCRQYSSEPIASALLSQLLWSAYGVTGDGLKSAPSAGGLYPLEIHVISRRVEGLAPGQYGYDEVHHTLTPIGDSENAIQLAHAVLEEQPWVDQAPLVIAVTADLALARRHFKEQPPKGERGSYYAYVESGAVAQNVYLQATALELGCVLVAGFDNQKVKTSLALSDQLEPTALLCLGHRE